MRQAIQTKYIGPTNFKGSRVKATSGGGHSITLGWDCALNQDDNHKAAARALCEKLGWPTDMIMGSLGNINVHVFKE